MAEALLRIPDEETRDRLISEKIRSADWAKHLGQSESLFVNASTWGLMLTGKLVEVDEDAKRDLPSFLRRVDLPERGGRWSDYLSDTRSDTRTGHPTTRCGRRRTTPPHGDVLRSRRLDRPVW